MSSVSDIKPWFRDTLQMLLSSLYFSKKMTVNQNERNSVLDWVGYLDGLTAVALAVGINPASFITRDDIELMKTTKRF